MNRTKLSTLNALLALILTLVNGLLGIVVTRLVIGYFGSDFNGLNSTVNQIVNVLLILEGGFTLASNVALFEPVSKEDYITANGILSATKKKFNKIGVLFLVMGIAAAIVYSFLVKTQLPREFVFTIIFMGVFPQAVNLFFATKYRVLLQTRQMEYIISGFTALTIGLSHLINILVVLFNGQMWMIRFVTMVFALINCILIIHYTKKKNPFIDFSVDPQNELIKGTNDVMAQKITGVIYTSWPIVFLSISSSGGTLLASVYAVYNSVFIMIKALLHGVIDAPRLGFGQMLTERKRGEVWPAFKEYEFVAVFFTFAMMITTCGMILPFIRLYTQGVDDVNYYDVWIAILMVLISTVEMLHIPSGHIINMSGHFKVSRNFQIIACALLISSMAALGYFFGVYGMLFSLLGVALLLAILEIGYVHLRFFDHKLQEYFLLILPFVIVGIVISWIEMKITIGINSIAGFMLWGLLLMCFNAGIALMIGLAFDKQETRRLFSRAKMLFMKLKHS